MTTFFERYFELLDGPDPHSSLELVAEDVEFSIQWAADGSRKSSQFLGGLEQLRGFIDAGDTDGLGSLRHAKRRQRRRRVRARRDSLG